MVLDVAANGSSGVKMVVSYGGEIVTSCSGTGKKARYAGGENRIVRVGMSERLHELRARLAALAGYPDVRIRYAVAGRLDALHDVADDHDLWVLVTRLCCCSGLASRDGRVRAFLFPVVNAPPRLTTPDGIPRPASSPSLLESSSNKQGRGVAAATATSTLPRAQSAMALLSTCTPASSSMALSRDEGSAAQVDSGFEALAEIAAAQCSATGKEASSSCAAASTGRADSGFEALAGIAAAQRSATGYTASGATCAAQQADSGFEALATVASVAGKQRVQVFPPPATTAVFLFLVLPVEPVAVFFHVIPVYGRLIPAVV